MLIHNQSKHGPKKFKCPECDKMFSQKVILKRHMYVHGDEKPHPCNQCDKSYPSQSKLQYHLNMHSGLKPFKCGPCDKSYPSVGGLRQHQKTNAHVSGIIMSTIK